MDVSIEVELREGMNNGTNSRWHQQVDPKLEIAGFISIRFVVRRQQYNDWIILRLSSTFTLLYKSLPHAQPKFPLQNWWGQSSHWVSHDNLLNSDKNRSWDWTFPLTFWRLHVQTDCLVTILVSPLNNPICSSLTSVARFIDRNLHDPARRQFDYTQIEVPWAVDDILALGFQTGIL